MNGAKENRENLALGMVASAGGILMFSVMNAFAKYLSARHSVVEIAFYRNLISCLLFLAFVFALSRRDILVIRSKRLLIATRALMGSVTLMVTFGAYSLMPMAETSVLLFTASLWIPVLGVLLLQERVGPFRWSAVVVGFIGVAVMANPAGQISRLGVALALAAAILQALLTILLRHLGGHERPETISFYFFLIGTVVTGLGMPFVAAPVELAELPLLLGVGLAGAAAQLLYTVALKHTPAAIVAVFNYTSIVWSMLFGWMIWHDWPLPIVLAGASVVIAANLLLVWRENRLRRRTAGYDWRGNDG